MVIHSKFKGYCSKCHFTIWQNEKIDWTKEKKGRHLDCLAAIKDPTPRVCDPRYLTTIGKISEKKLKERLLNVPSLKVAAKQQTRAQRGGSKKINPTSRPNGGGRARQVS